MDETQLEVFQRSDLSARAKGIYACIMSLPRELNKSELFLYFSEGRDALNRAFRELEDNNYLSTVRERKEDGKFKGLTIVLKKDLKNNE